MKTLFSFIFCVFVFAYCKGQITGTIYDDKENALQDASVFLEKDGEILYETLSDKNGKFSFDVSDDYQDETNILVTHIDYRNLKTKPKVEQKYFLISKDHDLEKIETGTAKKKKYREKEIERTLGFWQEGTFGISFESELATLIHSDLKRKKIKSLKYQLSNLSGKMKNNKYLPFNACIYTVDALTGKPEKCIYNSGKVEMKKNQKWFRINIDSLNITMPDEGLFIVFQILPKQYYNPPYLENIKSKIPYIPHLKHKKYNPNKQQKSYKRYTLKNEEYKDWQMEETFVYRMDFEF